MTSDKIVNKAIAIHASRLRVWHTLTNFDLIKRWLSPEAQTTATSDWQVGSPIIFSGIWAGRAHQDKGIILKFEPEKVLQYSYWSQISHLPDRTENYSIIEFNLGSEEDHTILTLTQHNFADEVIYKHWNFYWNGTLNKIRKIAEQL